LTANTANPYRSLAGLAGQRPQLHKIQRFQLIRKLPALEHGWRAPGSRVGKSQSQSLSFRVTVRVSRCFQMFPDAFHVFGNGNGLAAAAPPPRRRPWPPRAAVRAGQRHQQRSSSNSRSRSQAAGLPQPPWRALLRCCPCHSASSSASSSLARPQPTVSLAISRMSCTTSPP
jgi:hypothetical protein